MSSLLDRKRFGAVLRVFSRTSELVAKNVKQVLEAIQVIEALRIDGRRVFSEILVLVANDGLYLDHDCGETLSALRQELGASNQGISIHAIKHGDLFCGLPNTGLAKLNRKGCDYAFFMSHGARSFLTSKVIRQMMEALQEGAKVTGVAIPEIAQSIMEGRIANTFALWEIESLQTVGGFDLQAAQPEKSDKTALFLRGWDEDEGMLFYPRAGVEEIVPLVRLVKLYGPCIAPIPAPNGASWQEPDPAADPKGYRRSVRKLATKEARQMAHAIREGVDLSLLEGGVMPKYHLLHHAA